MDDRFKRAEEEYFRLKGQLAAGRITHEAVEASLKSMMVQDSQGRYWTLGVDDAKWYVYDGANWKQADPSAPAGTPALPGRAAPVQSSNGPRASSATSRAPLLVVAAVVVILVVILAIVAAGGLLAPKQAVVIAPFGTNTPSAQLSNPGTSTPEASTPQPSLAKTSGAVASSSVPDVKVSVVSIVAPTPIAASDFAALNAQLAQKIAALNQAELKFIRDMRAVGFQGRPAGPALPSAQKGGMTEQDIKDVAGKAMDVAILADQLGEMGAKQDKGSAKASQSSEAFFAIARNALSLAIDAQNVRTALNSGLIPGGKAIEVIGDYGAQLWNSAVTDGNTKGNPFPAQTNSSDPVQSLNPGAARQAQSQVNAGNSSIWIAQSNTQNLRTVDVPAPQSPVSNPFDPQVKSSLTTAEGQNDGNRAQQVAAANLQALGAKSTSTDPSQPTKLQVPSNPVAVAGGDQIKAGNIPSFKSGKATVISRNDSGDDNPFMQSLGLNGDGNPTDNGKTTVQDAPAVVSLNITDITITNVNKRAPGSGSFEADVNFSFTVNWATSLAAPQFKLNCNSHTESSISQPSGSLQQSANGLLIIYPGTITVYCYANSSNGQSLGSTSVNVLVGDADQATVRAQKVETDSKILDLTLTAEAQGTADKVAAIASQTAEAKGTIDALSTEVAGTTTAEFKLTAAAFETQRALPPPPSATPTVTPTFTPKVVDTVFHAGDVFAVSTKVVLQPGRLYRFTFSGLINLIHPTRSVPANIIPEHVNGVAVPASEILVIEGNGSVANITCGSGEPDPNDPGGYTITVEDLGPS